jgi:SPX domain protein involved in polyphosphate accumulation
MPGPELARRGTHVKPKSEPHRQTGRAQRAPSPSVDLTLRCRHEIKYLISEAQAQAIAQFVEPYLPPDRYCRLQPGGIYPIVSLYLDSSDLLLCRESLTGQKNRFKLRIRSYTDEADYPRFFEIKRRLNNVIIKSRARIMERDMQGLLAGLSLPPQDYTTDEEALGQFQLYMKSINAKPVILVRYLRQAFEGGSESRVRVTFDRDLCYNVTKAPEVKLDGSGWQRNRLTLGAVILEIKFTDCYPRWLSQMAERFDLRQQSISKYATSIKQSCLLRFCAPRIAEW